MCIHVRETESRLKMCGRARCTVRLDSVPAACGFRTALPTIDAHRYRPSFNVSPGSYIPVVRNDIQESSKEPVVHCMKWGLVPGFTKKNEKPDHFRMFNARSESVLDKATFRRLVPKSRCLAVVEGFYEWKKDGAKKQPYYIHLQDGRPLLFAALYDCWEDDQGSVLFTFTILTTRCSKALEWLHDRMPVILGTQEAVEGWLNQEVSRHTLQKLTEPYEGSNLVWYPVTASMGKTSFDGPECIKEITPKMESKNALSKLFGKKASNISDSNKHITSGDAKPEGSMGAFTGELLNEQELKALLAGIHPDHDATQKLEDEHKSENEDRGHLEPAETHKDASNIFRNPKGEEPELENEPLKGTPDMHDIGHIKEKNTFFSVNVNPKFEELGQAVISPSGESDDEKGDIVVSPSNRGLKRKPTQESPMKSVTGSLKLKGTKGCVAGKQKTLHSFFG